MNQTLDNHSSSLTHIGTDLNRDIYAIKTFIGLFSLSLGFSSAEFMACAVSENPDFSFSPKRRREWRAKKVNINEWNNRLFRIELLLLSVEAELLSVVAVRLLMVVPGPVLPWWAPNDVYDMAMSFSPMRVCVISLLVLRRFFLDICGCVRSLFIENKPTIWTHFERVPNELNARGFNSINFIFVLFGNYWVQSVFFSRFWFFFYHLIRTKRFGILIGIF